jgi:predicted PurR-regulated permease PerM
MELRRALFFLAIIVGFFWVLSPLLLPLAMGAVFATLFYPWQHRLIAHRVPPGPASAIITLGVTFGFLLPTLFLVITGAKMGVEQLGTLDVLKGTPSGAESGFFENLVDGLLARPSIKSIMDVVTDFFPISSQDIADSLREIARTIGLKVGGGLAEFVTHLPSILFSSLVMVVSIFFFMADGAKIAAFMRKNTALSPVQSARLIQAFTSMCRSVVLASLASGMAQALIFWIACLCLGVSNAVFIALLVFFCSFIPLVGAMPVTALVVLQQWISVSTGHGIGLLVAALIVGTVDNLIRPMVIKGAGNLHPMLAFVAAFGGLQVFGVAGVFLGPVIVGVGLAMVDVMNQPSPTSV